MTSADVLQNKNYFKNTIRVLNSLDPDQACCLVGPDLGPNCLQRLSADNRIQLRYMFNLWSRLSGKTFKCKKYVIIFLPYPLIKIYWNVVGADLGPNCLQRLSADNRIQLRYMFNLWSRLSGKTFKCKKYVIIFLPYPLIKIYWNVVGAEKNCLIEAVPLSTDKICFVEMNPFIASSVF